MGRVYLGRCESVLESSMNLYHVFEKNRVEESSLTTNTKKNDSRREHFSAASTSLELGEFDSQSW